MRPQSFFIHSRMIGINPPAFSKMYEGDYAKYVHHCPTRCVVLLLLLLLFTASCTGGQERTGIPSTTPQPTPRPVLTPSNAEPIKTDHYKISMAYLTNGVAANDEYKGKLVDISGEAGTISEEDGEIFVVFNWGASNPPLVTCYFDQSERVNVVRLRAGQKVTLRCIGAGIEKSKIEFRQCTIIN